LLYPRRRRALSRIRKKSLRLRAHPLRPLERPQPGFEALLTAYEAKFEAVQNPNRGKVDTLNKNESRTALEKAVRAYCKAYLLYNPKVTDEDRERMGLPVYSGGRSPVNVPASVPVRLNNPREVPVYYHDGVSGGRGKKVYMCGR
jgi:hypothetical protein